MNNRTSLVSDYVVVSCLIGKLDIGIPADAFVRVCTVSYAGRISLAKRSTFVILDTVVVPSPIKVPA